MNLRFTSPHEKKPGIITDLLKRSYAELINAEPEHWGPEERNWERYDLDVFQNPETIGACVFLSWVEDQLVGFGSFDPRQIPEFGILGYNCILPEFRGNGFGNRQIHEILARFQSMGIHIAKVSTCEHPFFVPAQRMYLSCGLEEKQRIIKPDNPKYRVIEYEMTIRELGNVVSHVKL
jgi:GNAT superfamily N-acetyltransferase